ncbi:hypothetical protein KC19_3G170300 [Ceratodon purpureus]|uniref:Agenet domain-containing protein n=1 Tax=Ceratodon purpureus TaxID=3225 RepID=A0A8T0IJE3_CERPU|nr:hypothetical protein KC19_3G170300 [Ceratodon purpureus]
MDFTRLEADVLMVVDDEGPIESDPKAIENADLGYGIFKQTESDGEHDLTIDGVANGHQVVDLNTLDMEIDDQQPPLEPPVPMAAASDDSSGGADPKQVRADLAENVEIVINDAFEKETKAPEHADTRNLDESPLIPENVNLDESPSIPENVTLDESPLIPENVTLDGSPLIPENVNDGDNDNAQVGNSAAPEENANVDESPLIPENVNDGENDNAQVGNSAAPEENANVDESPLIPENVNDGENDNAQVGNSAASEENANVDESPLIPENVNDGENDNAQVGNSAAPEEDANVDESPLIPENVNDGENDNAQVGNSAASEENTNVNECLESASDRDQLFNHVNLAQLKAQILVMGILRKGSSPSDDLLKTACPTSIEGTPSATVAEDTNNVARGNPSSSRKRKSDGHETLPCGNDGIVGDLLNAVRDSLHSYEGPDALLLDDTARQLHSAQVSAHDAMAIATSALAQSHLVWAQSRCEDDSESGIAREAQIASVAATIAAAAAVAKAAVEAAKAIANVPVKAFAQDGQIANGVPSSSRMKGAKKSSSARKRKSDMLDSVVKAAGMASEAATQAETFLASVNPLMQAAENRGTGSRSRDTKPRTKKTATRAKPQKKATKKFGGLVSASPKTTPLRVSKSVSTKNNVPPRQKAAKGDSSRGKRKSLKARKDSRQAAPPAKSTVRDNDLTDARGSGEVNEGFESIARGVVVEVMTEETGLRGGWFYGTVLKVAKGRAFVVYHEILNDDGSKLEEWFPFKASGDPAGPRRQVRPVHPSSSMRGAGSKKRQRVSMGSQTWTTGDHVDAFIEDAWWEGILVELNDVDESKATVYFPGENDIQTVKLGNLRSSLQWEDGQWVPWANSSVVEQNEHQRMQGKDGSSSSKVKKDKSGKAKVPKVAASAKNSKKKSEEIEAATQDVDESVPPRPTRKGKAQDLTIVATKAKRFSTNPEHPHNRANESIPPRSTRQGNIQELSANAPKTRNSSKNLEVSRSSPPRSSRKRKGLELSSQTKKNKKNPKVLVDPVIEPTPTRSTRSSPAAKKLDKPTPTRSTRSSPAGKKPDKPTPTRSTRSSPAGKKLDKPTPTRSTRSSPGGKKLDEMTTARDTLGKTSTSKVVRIKSSDENTKIPNKGPRKDVSSGRTSKKFALNVDTTRMKTTTRSETVEVTMTKTRGKLKAEEAQKQTRRQR